MPLRPPYRARDRPTARGCGSAHVLVPNESNINTTTMMKGKMIMKNLKKAIALCLSLMLILTFPVGVSAAPVADATINTAAKGNLTVFKYPCRTMRQQGCFLIFIAVPHPLRELIRHIAEGEVE